MTAEFIAEVSSNHHRELVRSLAFVEKAAEIGCQAVKFQLFRIADLFAPEILARRPELRAREAWELPLAFLPALATRAAELGLEFMCTPFYLEAIDELYPYVDAYKIASYELLWDDLLERCAKTGRRVILSVGMATLDEIQRAVGVMRHAGARDVTLLHCVSGYPTPPGECNLGAIETLREATGCPVGWSDHSVNSGVIHRAVHRWGARTIEFHLDLDGTGDEFKTGHCWLPDQMAAVIRSLADGVAADGGGEKVPAPSERVDRDWRADPSDGLRPLRKMRELITRNS